MGQSTFWHCMWGRSLSENSAICWVFCPISSHFPHFLYADGTLLATALVLIPRVGGFVYILGPCGPLNRLSWETGSFFHHAMLHWFLQPEVLRFYIASTGIWDAWTSLGLEWLAPQVSSQFPSATGECGTACSASCCYQGLAATATLCPPHPDSLYPSGWILLL